MKKRYGMVLILLAIVLVPSIVNASSLENNIYSLDDFIVMRGVEDDTISYTYDSPYYYHLTTPDFPSRIYVTVTRSDNLLYSGYLKFNGDINGTRNSYIGSYVGTLYYSGRAK